MAESAILPLRALIEAHRDEIEVIAVRHQALSIAIFGSVARGDETAESDIDFLVDFRSGASLFDLVRMQDDLEALLGRSVDVVSSGGLLPEDDDIREDVLPL